MSSPSPDATDTIGLRFADHGKELGTLAAQLSGPVKTAEIAGRVMMLAGDVLRRTQALGTTATVAKQALKQVDEAAALAFVQSIDPTAEKARLSQAMNEAFEAMLETDGEGKAWAEAALEGLLQRDRLASIGAALDHKGLSRESLDSRLAQIDGTLAKKARMLVGLNQARRAELEALDPGARSAAWWYGARAKCDRLRALYTGQDVTGDAHVSSCDDCRRDVAAAGQASVPSHLDAMSLERRESGTASRAEIAWMDAHAKTCNGCKRALDALSISVD